MNNQIQRQGIAFLNNQIYENAYEGYNHFGGFSNYFYGTFSGPSSGQYTVTSAVISTAWGSGVQLTNQKITVPYNCLYRVVLDIYVPSEHKIVIDINNKPPTGFTAWNGNDNDDLSSRTATQITIPATTWTTISWGSLNARSTNTEKADLIIYDGIGLVTSADTEAITWYIKNPRVYVAYNTKDKCSIDSSNIYANNFYEI